MKKTTIFKVLGLLLLIIVASCSKEELIVNSPEGQSNLKSAVIPTNDELLPTVGCNEITFQLVAGKDVITPAGTVNFSLDGDWLNVCFSTVGTGWILDEVHFFIGLLEDVPVNAQNIPNPGHFPYSATGINSDSYCYDPIPSSVIPDCADEPVILVHAVVINPNAMQEETAWAYGCNTFADAPFNSKRWGYWDNCSCFECDEPETKYLTFKSIYLPEGAKSTTWPCLDYNYGIKPFSGGQWCASLGLVVPVDGAIYDLYSWEGL